MFLHLIKDKRRVISSRGSTPAAPSWLSRSPGPPWPWPIGAPSANRRSSAGHSEASCTAPQASWRCHPSSWRCHPPETCPKRDFKSLGSIQQHREDISNVRHVMWRHGLTDGAGATLLLHHLLSPNRNHFIERRLQFTLKASSDHRLQIVFLF